MEFLKTRAKRFNNWLHQSAITFRVGRLLAFRQIRHANKWTTALIVFIMFLTFLNLVVVSGVLIGLIEGSFRANIRQYTGNVFISTLSDENTIENSRTILSTLETLPGVDSYTARDLSSVTIEANYNTRRDFNTLPNSFSTTLTGIDPEAEDEVTELSDFIIEGEMLEGDESGYILLGSLLVDRYTSFSDLFEPLRDIYPGTRVKLTVSNGNVQVLLNDDNKEKASGNTAEFIVKGILKSKVDAVEQRIFVTEADFRRLTRTNQLNVEEIAVKAKSGVSNEELKAQIIGNGFERFAKIETGEEAIPKFLDDIKATFGILGTLIGSIGIVVSSITIFIVVYINAITRQKSIGILKGIGIRGRAIEIAYTLQALFYAGVGSILAIVVIYLFLIPFIDAHPINFPFSDGILVATASGTTMRFVLLMLVTFAAGFLPAWLIVRRNTLDSILGR